MITRAEIRYVRLSPRKFRQIVPLVKGKRPEEAIALLMSVNKKASIYAIALLKSAIANAKKVAGLEPSELCISSMIANCGPQLKRFRAASMGRASRIRKRTSHLSLELDRISDKSTGDAHKEHKEAKAESAHAEVKKDEAKKITKVTAKKKRKEG